MKKGLLIGLLIARFIVIEAQNNSCLIITEGSQTFYVHTENKFEINESSFGNQEIHIQTDNGEIKRFYKGNYAVKPALMGGCTISIHNKDKSKELYSERFDVTFSVKPEIQPSFASQEHKISGNEIPKDRLEDLQGFSTMVYGTHGIIFMIDEMNLKVYSKSKGEHEFVTDYALNDETKKIINSLNEGDMIVLKNIKVKSFTDPSQKDKPDQIFMVSPTVYFVK